MSGPATPRPPSRATRLAMLADQITATCHAVRRQHENPAPTPKEGPRR